MSIAQLGYEIDSSQALTAERNLDRMGEAAGRASNDAQGLEKQSSGLSRTLRALAPIAGTIAGSLAAMFSARAVIGAAEQYENRMARVNAVIQATGGVAGRTAEQLEASAQALARATLESVDGVMQAQQVLLTFRNVQGEVFDRAIESAADLSAAMGQDLTASTRQLARALEDPIQGVTALTRSGTVFTQQQRDMIRTLVESGDMLGAQTMILDELEGQYGGVARAGAGLREAKDSLSQSVLNLLIGLNDTFRVNERLTNAYNAAADAVQWLADNVDSLRGYVIAASVATGAYVTGILYGMIPAMRAWIAANVTLVGTLALLRTALIATGVGAFIVLAGTAINYLIRLREATASWGEVFPLVRDLFMEVMERIFLRVEAVRKSLLSFALGMRSGFLDAAAAVVEGVSSAVNAVDAGVTSLVNMAISGIASMVNVAIDGLNAVIELANKVPGVNIGTIGQFAPEGIGSVLGGVSGALDGISSSLREQSGLAAQTAEDLGNYSDVLTQLADRPLESVAAIKSILAEAGDQTDITAQQLIDAINSVNNAIGGSGSGGGGGSSEDDAGLLSRFEALQDELRTQAEQVELWYMQAQETLQWALENERLTLEEHAQMKLEIERLYQEQLAAIRGQAANQQLSDAAGFFGAMASVAQQGGERMTKVVRVFSAVQALINSWVAYTEMLKDPSFVGRPWARFAAAASVLAAGLGAVAAIRGSGGGSGGGSAPRGGGSSAPSRAEGVTQQQAPLRRTIVELRGPDWVKGIVQPVMEKIYEASEDGQVVFAR